MFGLEKKSTSLNIIVLIILTFLLKGIGFVNRIIIAKYFGVSSFTDIYYIASGFTDAIAAIFLASLSVGIVTIVSHYKDDFVKVSKFVSNVLFVTECIIVILICLLFLFTNKIAQILTINISSWYQNNLVHILRLLLPSLFFTGITSILCSLLQAKNNFVPEKIVGAISSAISIIAIITLAHFYSEKTLSIAYNTACVVNAIFIVSIAKKSFHFKISIKNCINDEDLRKLVRLSIPLFIGLASHEVNLLIDKAIATSLGEGNVSSLAYGGTLYIFIENIIIASIVTVLFPDLAKLFVDGKHYEIAEKTRLILFISELLLIPITIVFFFHGQTIVRIIYMRGCFDNRAMQLTASGLSGYVVGLPFLIVKDIFTRVLYAYENTKVPLYVNLVSVVFNIILDFLLSRYFGIMGITLATAISIAFSSITMYFCSLKCNGLLKIKIQFYKLVSFCFLIVCACCLSYVLRFNNSIIIVFISFIALFMMELLYVRIFFKEKMLEIIKNVKHIV